jgi:hypothetical protein
VWSTQYVVTSPKFGLPEIVWSTLNTVNGVVVLFVSDSFALRFLQSFAR